MASNIDMGGSFTHMVSFQPLKYAKGVPRVSNFHRNIVFFLQLPEFLQNFINNAKIYSKKVIFWRFRVIFQNFSAICLQRVQNFGLQRIRI